MRVIVSCEVPAEGSLRVSWNSLLDEMENAHVFYTYEWAIAVQRAYASILKPLIFLFYEEDKLVGIAPLATSLSGRRGFFLTATTADYCDILCNPEYMHGIWECLQPELRKLGIETLVLANLPEDSPTHQALRQSRTCGFHSHVRKAYDCARVVLGSTEHRAEIRSALHKKKVYRRAIRQMTSQGFEVLHLREYSDVSSCLEQFYAAHIARFRATGRRSNIEDSERRWFLTELARELCATQSMVLSCLRLNGVRIAWNYGFCFRGCWFWYQPTFDSAYEDFSPGFSLLGKIIEASCDDPEIAIVDLGLGAEEYKDRFATSVRRTVYATLQRSRVSHVQTAMRYRLSTLVKQSPYAERKIRQLMQKRHRETISAPSA